MTDAIPVSLSHITRVALTAECTYSSKAKQGARIHVVSSPDGIHYDTTDLYTFDSDFNPGQKVQRTFDLDTHVRFIKILMENLDQNEIVSEVKVSVTLGG